MSQSVLKVGNTAVTVDNIFTFMKINGNYENAQRYVIMNEVIKDHAKHADVHVDDDTLQAFSDLRRLELGLTKSEDMQHYLNNLGISLEDWEDSIESELYRHILRRQYGNSLYVTDVWRFLKGIPEVRQHVTQSIINYSKEKGIAIDDNELQEHSDALRRALGLFDASEFNSLLSSLNMSEEEWESFIHAKTASQKSDDLYSSGAFSEIVKDALAKYPVVNTLVSDLVFGKIMHAKAKKNDISVSDDELQEYTDNIRRSLGLHSVNAFTAWLSATGMDQLEFEYLAETEILKAKFAASDIKLFDRSKVLSGIKASHFFSNALNGIKNLTALENYANENGITVSENDLNQESDDIRRALGLHNSEEFKNYMAVKDITENQWEWFVERNTVARKLYSQQVTDEAILNYLNTNEAAKAEISNRTFGNWVNSVLSNQAISW